MVIMDSSALYLMEFIFLTTHFHHEASNFFVLIEGKSPWEVLRDNFALGYPSVYVWIISLIPRMAPKQPMNVETGMGSGTIGQHGKGKRMGGHRGCRGRVTRAQTQAQAATSFFRNRISMEI